MKTASLKDFQTELLAQGVPQVHLAFKCPRCGTVQSAHDLIAAGAGNGFDEVEKYLGFSCVGRFAKEESHEYGTPRKGCDWTLGGLFRIHKLEVITEDGAHHPRFEPATKEEAQQHMGEVTA